MPRKTRKAKQQAQEKRHMQISPQGIVKREFEFSLSSSNLGKYTAKKIDNSPQLKQNELLVADLVKTSIIALGIFSLELVIYWSRFR